MKRVSKAQLLLAGDVGGTKTVLALYPLGSSNPSPVAIETYPSRAFDSFTSIVALFLEHQPKRPACAAIAVGGPVLNDQVDLTNLPWTIEAGALRALLEIPAITLLNDLEALAWEIPYLTTAQRVTLNPGELDPTGSIAILSPGTGLGEAFLTWDGARYVGHPSEGGHADFAPADPLQIELLSYLLREYDHISTERVCSGTGIPHLYRFLRDRFGLAEESSHSRDVALAPDPTPAIIAQALSQESTLCVKTLELFAEILAAEAGNLALKVLATGGVYLGGGIPPRILPFLETSGFIAAFTHKGRFTSLLRRIPVHVVLDPLAVLHGAERCGAECNTDPGMG
jgi:glucokinase